MENNQINKITTPLYLVEISVEPNVYYAEGEYVLVSPVKDGKIHNKMIEAFVCNSSRTNFAYGFIIPKSTYENVLKPVFDAITAHNKQITEVNERLSKIIDNLDEITGVE